MRITLLVLLMGCAHTPIDTSTHTYTNLPPNNPPVKLINVWIDPRFSVEDKVSIEKALSEWNYSLNGLITLASKEYPVQGGWEIIKSEYAQFPPEHKNTLAYTDAIAGHIIYIARDRFLTQRALYEGVVHEAGHLLGMVHTSDYGQGLTRGRFDLTEYQCIDYLAVKEVALWNRLPVDKMNWCTVDRTEKE